MMEFIAIDSLALRPAYSGDREKIQEAIDMLAHQGIRPINSSKKEVVAHVFDTEDSEPIYEILGLD